jgi:hypothetical protein
MWLGYRMHWAWLDWVDTAALDWAHGYGVSHPGWVRLWDVVGTVAGLPGLRLLGAAVIVYAVLAPQSAGDSVRARHDVSHRLVWEQAK